MLGKSISVGNASRGKLNLKAVNAVAKYNTEIDMSNASSKLKPKTDFDIFEKFHTANYTSADIVKIKLSTKINSGMGSHKDFLFSLWDYVRKNSPYEERMWKLQAFLENHGEESK